MSAPAELPESQATGAIAGIFADLRRLTGVPYVSSIYRHLATMPGMLEWAWDTLGPGFTAGTLQEAGAAIAVGVQVAPAPRIAAATLAGWGVDATALGSIRAACAGFIRVAPVNLVTGACLGPRLDGVPASGLPIGGAGFPPGWTPPPSLPPVPPTADPASLPAATRALLDRLATDDGTTRFVPGLYRQLAHWPDLLAWVAEVVGPRLTAPETLAASDALRAAAARAAAAIGPRLPPCPPAPLDPPTLAAVRRAIARYARTSPELTLFGRLIAEALPG